MEENRLKPMVAGYDEQMFNRLYEKTHNLRRKLARQIDARRFGLDYEDVLSFFDVKFLFVFNKYCTQFDEQILFGHLISGLSMFKQRILRSAYTLKNSQNIVSPDTVLSFESTLSEQPSIDNDRDKHFNVMMDFMKKHLSQNAYTVLEIQLNPPPYILYRLNTDIDSNLQKIPDQLILDYFDMGFSDKAYKVLNSIKKEIRNATNLAKIHFKSTTFSE